MMTQYLLILGAAVAAAVLVPMLRRKVVPDQRVRLSETPKLIRSLAAAESEPAFFVYLVDFRDREGVPRHVEVQYSKENGVVGFDWVLLAQDNVADQERVRNALVRFGHAPATMSMNGVNYIRVETGEMATMAPRLLSELYDISDSTEVSLIVDGFRWLP